MRRTASAIARDPDREQAENEARAKVAEVFGDDPYEIDRVDFSWSATSAKWAVRVDASQPDHEGNS